MALRYVGRYATSRAKLARYLKRKLRERGWEGPHDPDIERLATRCAELGYVDDAAYALSKSQALSSRGYGKARLQQTLRVAGIAEEDSEAARALADQESVSAALRFAERRKIGPFGRGADLRQRERAIAAMVRAGHAFGLSRVIASLSPGAEIDVEELRRAARLSDA